MVTGVHVGKMSEVEIDYLPQLLSILVFETRSLMGLGTLYG